MGNRHGVVLVGCGHIGKEHIQDIYYRDGISIVGVVDLDENRAAEFAKKYGAESWSSDYKKYLGNPDADIFIIATYASTHLEILRDCLKYGKHVLCEKPVAPTLEEGKEFMRLVRSADSKVLVGHILRHNDTYNKVAGLIHSGKIGDLSVFRMVQNHHTMDWPRYKRLLQDCPPVIDCGVHYFDVMQWFSKSKIIRVGGISTVVGDDVPKGTYNYSMVTAWLSNGAVAYYEAGWGKSISASNIKEFIGTKGRLSITLAADRKENREEGDLIRYYNSVEGQYSDINVKSQYKPMWKQLQCLIGMIDEGNEGSPTLEEMFSAFKVACTADKAIRENKILNVADDYQVLGGFSKARVLTGTDI